MSDRYGRRRPRLIGLRPKLPKAGAEDEVLLQIVDVAIRDAGWRVMRPRRLAAARYEASLSVTIVCGWIPWFFSNRQNSCRAACLLRRF